jgi:WD40 repeat protein
MGTLAVTRTLLTSTVVAAILLLGGCAQESKPTSSLEVASKGAQGAAISPDGDWAVVGSVHQGGSLWKISSRERLFNWNHRKDEQTTILSADFSPDGKWAITADPHTLVLWNVETGQPLRFWTSPGEVLSIALSNSTRNGLYALLGLSDHSAVIFNVDKGRISRTFNHQGRVRAVDLSDDLNYALTGSEDQTAVLWDVKSGKAVHRMEHQNDVQIVALSPDGKRAFSAGKYDKALVWNTDDGELINEVPIPNELLIRGLRFTSARFNETGSKLLTGKPDQTVQLWNIAGSGEIKENKRWRLPKRDAWKPTGAAVIALSFDESGGTYHAVASNGFIHTLK